MTGLHDTIAAIATAPGAAGVAVVRVSGPDARSVAGRVAGALPEAGRFAFAKFRNPSTGEVADEGLVLSFVAPRSYTGEDVVELQGHGGSVAPRRVLEACLAAGARLARRGEFTERAFLNGKLGLDEAESLLDFINAKTDRAADAALAGMEGARKRELRKTYDAIVDLAAAIENALDVDESELSDTFFDGLLSALGSIRLGIDEQIRREREGVILREGALVVLAGPPNAGKSSLMNALLRQERAIVSSTPGTTRDTIEEWLDVDGWPVRLVDTAGLRETEDAIEAEGVRRAKSLVGRADIVLALDCDIEGAVRVHAKCDLGPGEGIPVSALTGEGLDELRRVIAMRLEALREGTDDVGNQGEASIVPALTECKALLPSDFADLVISANALRSASARLAPEIGADYSSDVLDRLFSRFCVGK